MLGRQALPLASLEDIVRSKTAAGREKDLKVLPILLRFLRRRSDNKDTSEANNPSAGE